MEESIGEARKQQMLRCMALEDDAASGITTLWSKASRWKGRPRSFRGPLPERPLLGILALSSVKNVEPEEFDRTDRDHWQIT